MRTRYPGTRPPGTCRVQSWLRLGTGTETCHYPGYGRTWLWASWQVQIGRNRNRLCHTNSQYPGTQVLGYPLHLLFCFYASPSRGARKMLRTSTSGSSSRLCATTTGSTSSSSNSATSSVLAVARVLEQKDCECAHKHISTNNNIDEQRVPSPRSCGGAPSKSSYKFKKLSNCEMFLA